MRPPPKRMLNMRAFPAVSAPDEVVRLRGRRVPVTAKVRAEAMLEARQKAWWPWVLSKRPIYALGRFWWVVDDEFFGKGGAE